MITLPPMLQYQNETGMTLSPCRSEAIHCTRKRIENVAFPIRPMITRQLQSSPKTRYSLPIQVIAISASVFIGCGCLICRPLFHKRQAVAEGVDLGWWMRKEGALRRSSPAATTLRFVSRNQLSRRFGSHPTYLLRTRVPTTRNLLFSI